ncbi:MATE family efflux transporter [Bariatricus sp. SGI.154]|uniref:MATE family efflux transporter n=1 Tax=Bariatricus sp. SGI.154 TaxID=3420549 RepID=UPI003D074198
MRQERRFYKTVLNIALPVTLQSLLSSSFSVVDQIMTGQLGSTSIAGIGLGGKFSSIFSVLLSAIATVAGIMIAQYMGKRSDREVSRSFWLNLCMAFGLAVIFMAMCVGMPMQIMRLYTEDEATRKIAAEYLSILAISYIPMAAGSLVSTLLRCMEAAMLPLYSSVFGAVVNTGLNYVLIFGKLGFPRMGVKGAALASVISQVVSCLLTLSLFLWHYQRQEIRMEVVLGLSRNGRKQYIGILFPILACEFLWSFGENVYTAIYGHMGTSACAAMTLTIPIQVLMIGALSGVSQAAGVIIGKALGSKEYDRAYCESKKLMLYGLGGSVILSIGLMAVGKYYVGIYQVEQAVRITACQILVAFALISPVKVQNMILGGGIIRSGGKTNYVMWIDMIGTWIFGVPLGLLAAFVWKLSIPYVYFVLSLEECVRFGISVWVFRRRKWMNSLE